MTKATRAGYSFDVVKPKTIRMRRGGPRDPVELVVALGNHECVVYELTEEMHEGITRDSHDLWFYKRVLA